MRKTIAQEEQRLEMLQRDGAQMLEHERKARRRLAITLKVEQMRADRLESAVESCGQQIASALSPLLVKDGEETSPAIAMNDNNSRHEDMDGSTYKLVHGKSSPNLTVIFIRIF